MPGRQYWAAMQFMTVHNRHKASFQHDQQQSFIHGVTVGRCNLPCLICPSWSCADLWVCVQPPVAGFRYIDYTQAWGPDRMHLDGNGILRTMIDELQGMFSAPDLETVRQNLDDKWKAPSRPSEIRLGGIASINKRLTAVEVVALAKALAVALASVHPDAALCFASMCPVPCHGLMPTDAMHPQPGVCPYDAAV